MTVSGSVSYTHLDVYKRQILCYMEVLFMMSDFGTIYVYGDSIMKATCPDEDMRYHFHIDEFLKGFKRCV